MKIRHEKPADRAAVRRINEQAFRQGNEADLVEALNSAGAAVLSLVAVDGRNIVGHIMFSAVTVESASGLRGAIGLAPMAVLPERQKQGVGSMLVRAGLDELREMGHEAVFVLGHPSYYPGFGFVRASTYRCRWESEAPDEAFMAIELKPGALSGRPGGVVRFRAEFEAV
ncbi:MAG: N-acetyltransferase [Myxococcota bacterium]|jgi:putative acetyltransferase